MSGSIRSVRAFCIQRKRVWSWGGSRNAYHMVTAFITGLMAASTKVRCRMGSISGMDGTSPLPGMWLQEISSTIRRPGAIQCIIQPGRFMLGACLTNNLMARASNWPLSSVPVPATVTRIWSRKSAGCICSGKGLTVTVISYPDSAHTFRPRLIGGSWQPVLRTVFTPGYTGMLWRAMLHISVRRRNWSGITCDCIAGSLPSR